MKKAEDEEKTMENNAAPEKVVDDFIAAIERKDLDAALALVTDECYYDNVPLGDMRGRAAMRDFLAPMTAGDGPVEFQVHRQAAAGNLVFNERTDSFMLNGKSVDLPVAGVFEVEDGLISFWRDYFDRDSFTKQLKA